MSKLPWPAQPLFCYACGRPLPAPSAEMQAGALEEMRINEGDIPESKRAAVCSDCYAKVLAVIAPGVKPRTK